jgi:hypothetical protein
MLKRLVPSRKQNIGSVAGYSANVKEQPFLLLLLLPSFTLASSSFAFPHSLHSSVVQ